VLRRRRAQLVERSAMRRRTGPSTTGAGDPRVQVDGRGGDARVDPVAKRVGERVLERDATGQDTEPETFARWRAGMREVARAPNTVVKISGLGQADHRWTVASLRPWVLECIEAFGTDRAFFATNWPVDRLYSSYGDVVDAYAELIAGFSETEQRALFAGNAERIFRLGEGSA